MDISLQTILNEIKGKEHLEKLLNSKIKGPLIEKNFSLLDIYNLTDEEFTKIDKLGVTKLSFLNRFKLQVDNESEYFENYYHYVVNVPIQICNTINPEKSIASHLLDSLTQISNILEIKSKLPENFFQKIDYNAFLQISNYMNEYFGLNANASLNFKEIGFKYDKSSENIRTNLFDYKNRPDLCDLFLNAKQGFGLEVNQTLLSSVNKTLQESIYSSNFLEYFSNHNEVDIIQVEKLVELFRLECIQVNFDNLVNSNYTIVRKGESGIFRAHLTVLDSVLREGNSLTKNEVFSAFEQIIPKLNSTKSNIPIISKGINKQILDVLLDDYFKIEIIEDDDKLLYQFKWEYLSSLNAKLERILLENGSAMHKEEILNVYNQRAAETDLEIIPTLNELHIKKTDKIKPKNKSGYWFYSENNNEATQETIAKFIDQTVIEQFIGKVNFNQLKEFIANTPYSIYPESSLRTNLFLCSRRAVEDENLFIHQDFLEKYPEIKTVDKRNRYLGNSLIKTIVKIIRSTKEKEIEKGILEKQTMESLKNDGFRINGSGNYYSYLQKFVETGILLKQTINNNTFYTIDEHELKNHDLEKLGKKAEPDYKKNVRAHAISFLKENKKAKLIDLKVDVEFLMPKGISYSNFYRVFQDRELFIKEQIESDVWISLETSLLPVPQELHIEVQEESTELLGNKALTERVRYDLTKLKSEVINELSSEINFYKMNKEELSNSFDIFYTAILDTTGNITRWGDSLLQSLYELLCTKTDYYDRETCLNKLITGFETYLKCYILESETKLFIGQADVINHFNSISDLRKYKDIERIYRTDIKKTNFSYILSRIKYLSDQTRHNKNHESLDMGFNKQIKNAFDFIALYLFTGHLIKST